MQKRWTVKKTVSETSFIQTWNTTLHPFMRTILVARGIATPEDAHRFLLPSLSDMIDPLLLKDMPAAIERLLQARHKCETICIYGDYDVDGITGTSLLTSFLRTTGFSCLYFIPNRFEDGYGLNINAIERIIQLGATLIVSVDCGITAVDEARYCRERCIDLIIVDHHMPREEIPEAIAVLNPLQPGCSYPFKSLAGVGVAFNLLIALRKALRDDGAFVTEVEPDLRKWLYLVALGTIADLVPLTGQNRLYAFHGLRQLSISKNPGIMALMQVAGVKGEVNCGQVGFRLAPRLNAAGRLESAVLGVELLLSSCSQQSLGIATELDVANAERQTIERRIFDEAVDLIETANDYKARRSIVLASENWHQGVVGIVASRLVERYHRPTILIALCENGMAKGSGRSIPGFHLLNALAPCSHLLERFGGHRYAAGVSLKTEHVDIFADAFEVEAALILTDDDLVPRLDIDIEARPHEITQELVLELKRLEPFGAGNPEPVLMMRKMTIVERKIVGDGHLRLRVSKDGHTFAAIAFRMAERETQGLVDIAFYPEMNVWNGSSSLQLRVKDFRPAE